MAETKPLHDPLSAEQSMIEARRAKAERVRARSENPFANDVGRRGPVDDIAGVRESVSAASAGGKYEAASVEKAAAGRAVHVCGRVIALRSTGALSFARIRDRTGEIQLMLDEGALKEEYERLADIDVGDFVEASGALTASKRAELSVTPNKLRLVTKSYRPLPEKWHGLTDVELRYRQRYVDLVANPPVADVFRARSHIVRATREILDAHGFLEVETPTMHPIVGGAAARPFVTHHNTLDMRLYMRIAPELYLKRLVVGGFDRVYEINRNFRNEGLGWRWNPEFTMLEFYQAYTDYQGVMDLTQELIAQAAKDVTGGTKTKWGDQEIDWANWQRLTMREAIIHYWPETAGAKPVMGDFASDDGVRKLVERFNQAHA